MALERKSACRIKRFALVTGLILCGLILCLPARALDSTSTEEAPKPGPDKYRAFLLRNISPEQAKQFLADVNITNVSQLNDSNSILVSAGSSDLAKAAGILSLVDSREKYAIKALLPASEANKMPSPEKMAAEIGKISIGTFLNAPGGTGYKAALDTHDDKLYVVAPAAVMDKFLEYAAKVKGTASLSETEEGLVSRTKTAEESQADKAYNELLNSISKAAVKPKSGTSAKLNTSLKSESITIIPKKQTTEKKTTASAKKAAEPNLETAAATEQNTEENDQNQYEPEYSAANANETLELALPEKLSVIDLLELVGKYLNLNYVYDPKTLQGKEVYLKIQGPIKVRDLYPLAESVLRFTGLAMTRKGNLVSISTITDTLDIDPELIETDKERVKAGDVVVTRVFQLNYIDTTSAKTLLETMKLGTVTEIAARGTIIITGYAYRMKRVEELLDVVDKPGRPKICKFRKLNYTMAVTLAPKVKSLVEQLGDISIAIGVTPSTAPNQPIRRPPVRQPTPIQPTPAAAAGGAPSSKPSVFLDADERTNRILIIGQEEEIAVVDKLIDDLDVAQQDLRSIRVYEIQHVDAEDVRKKLEELGIVSASRSTAGTAGGRITARTATPTVPGQPAVAPTPTPAATGTEGELPTEELQVVVLESTNSLMVNALPEQHALIATIISYVDSESEQKAIPYKVYPLQNQAPDHIAEVIKKLLEDVVKDKEGKIEKVVKKTEENIIVVPDPNTFSLIVYANKKNQDWVADLIKTLDKRRPQVLIDVTLVEITNTDSFNFDLQLATKLPEMVAGGAMTEVGSIVSPFPAGIQREAASSPLNNSAQAFYSDRHIQALLTAMQSKNYGRVLAKPKILVNDGQVGMIESTTKKNVPITSAAVVSNGVAVPGSTTFQSYDAGITLTIQPNISEGDLLLLIIKLERSDFAQNADPNRPPDTTANKVDTIVTVPNDATIILGGMLKLNQNKGGSKVPILGDIPLVGGLFRSAKDTTDDSKLYIFVKANILRPETTLAGLPELEKISNKSRDAFEKHEEQFQNHQDWPGIKPHPVDPVKVLEAE